jgi:hypothetical protein
VVSQRLTFAKVRVHCSSNPHAICGGQNDTGTGFCASSSVVSCQPYSASGTYSLIYLILTTITDVPCDLFSM